MSYELLTSIKNADPSTLGVVGFVDIVKEWNSSNIWKPLVIYQYCEYLYAFGVKFIEIGTVSKIKFVNTILETLLQL
jgi:hypothetical protein